MRDERLVELHHVGDVPIRRVELEHGELGIVGRIDAFVAKDAPDLVDALHSGDDQPLEIELGRDAHAHQLVEGVTVRHEGARRRAAGDVQQRRCFDLVKAAIVDEAPHLGDQAAAGHHRLEHVGIDDHVDVPLAIALLDILKTVPFVGQRHERFSQGRERGHVQRQLAHLRAEHIAAQADQVAALQVAPIVQSHPRRLLLYARRPAAGRCGRRRRQRPSCPWSAWREYARPATSPRPRRSVRAPKSHSVPCSSAAVASTS